MILLSNVLLERRMPKHLISVLSLHHSAKWDVGVVPDTTAGITALEIEEELFGQEILFVPGVSNCQSVSGSLEPTTKKKHQGWGWNLGLGDPQAGESLCAHVLSALWLSCLNNSFWTW